MTGGYMKHKTTVIDGKGFGRKPQSDFQREVADILAEHLAPDPLGRGHVAYSKDGKTVRVMKPWEYSEGHTATEWAEVIEGIVRGEGLKVHVRGYYAWPKKVWIALVSAA